ncbi:MAG: hypothetical protein AAB915_00565 [Patescibacteria group bacterium]
MTKKECQNLIEKWKDLKDKESNLGNTFDSSKPHSFMTDPDSGKLVSELVGIEEKLKEECADCLDELDDSDRDILKSILRQ